jgi:hypothetical protein
MTALTWTWLITLAVSILLGWLAVKYDNQKTVAYLVALTTASIGATIGLYFEIMSARAEQSAMIQNFVPTLKSPIWSSVVKDIAEYDRQNQASPLEATLYEPLRQIITQSIYQAREGLIEVPNKNEVVIVTDRLLDQAQESVRATSYIHPDEWWGSDIAQTYGEHLKPTRQRVKLFQRLFIVASTEEMRSLKPVMDAQQKTGIEVKFTCASSIVPDRREDFIIVDNSVAAILDLDEKRHFRTSRFFSTKVRAQDFDTRFTNLWISGRPSSQAGKDTCPPLNTSSR